ncbi:hypothetical protein AKG30_13960 (plasmid) [Lacticaseibacillus paracasei]|jgi:hypothetical protein|nr:hypothetical protein AKG30_13960 [Lacticaseibacillus paracasei]AWN85342.1 hypothetical protein LPEG9_15550 [Lacticaseibacillus paracasei]
MTNDYDPFLINRRRRRTPETWRKTGHALCQIFFSFFTPCLDWFPRLAEVFDVDVGSIKAGAITASNAESFFDEKTFQNRAKFLAVAKKFAILKLRKRRSAKR